MIDVREGIVGAFGVLLWGLLFLVVAWIACAHARSGPQWDDKPESIQYWFKNLMQPDNPYQSCCGESDAFDADDFEVDGDHYVAIITDGHDEIPNGTRIPVPNIKVKWDKGNPTGHGILFLSRMVAFSPPQAGYIYVLVNGDQARILYCYVPPAGI